MLAHLLNEPIIGNAYFWAAPHQPFVLPARIRNFEHQYKMVEGQGKSLDQVVDTGLEAVKTADQKMIQRLAAETRALIAEGGVRAEAVAEDDTKVVIYKPRLAAGVGKLMADEERAEHCSGGEDDRTFVHDNLLDQIVAGTGLCDGEAPRVRGTREDEGKTGDFYEFPRAKLPPNLQPSGRVTLR